MKKYILILFAILSFYSIDAIAKVCFLPGHDCDLDYNGNSNNSNEDNPQSDCKINNSSLVLKDNQCEALTYKYVCTDNTGVYFQEKGCANGFTDMSLSQNQELYDCLDNVLACGKCCPNNKVECKTDKFKECPYPTKGTGQKCQSPIKGDDIKYERCVCDTQKYPYTKSKCNSKATQVTGETCRGDNGIFYEKCICKDGFEPVYPETINCESQCSTLGYEEYKTYNIYNSPMVCFAGCKCKELICEYYGELSCLENNKNATCEKDEKGCWIVSDCSKDFNLSKCPDNGICEECTLGTTTKYKLTDCKEGYSKLSENATVCTKNYSSCEDAGFKEFSPNCKDGNYRNITLTDGSQKICCAGEFCSGTSSLDCENGFFHSVKCISYNGTRYGECSDIYSSCEDIGACECKEGMKCSGSKTIYTNQTGTKKKCSTTCEWLCSVGDVYYSDGSCSNVDKYDSSKIAVGVVYALSDTKGGMPYETSKAEKSQAVHGRVIALKNLVVNSSENIALTHKKVSNVNIYKQMKEAVKSEDFYQGKKNTELVAQVVTTATEAPKATLAYYPYGIESNHIAIGIGQWYVPTMGELLMLYGLDRNKVVNYEGEWISTWQRKGSTGETKAKVNKTLNYLINKGIDAKKINKDKYLSVTFRDDGCFGYLWMDNGTRSTWENCLYKSDKEKGQVRPSLEF